MKLYLLRHAIAEERDEDSYPDDSLRPLSEKGKKKMVKMAKNLADLGIQLDMVLSSPYVRALETAKIVEKAFVLNKQQLMLSEHLKPAGSGDNLIAEINEKYMVDNLMLVGHEPHMSSLISVLLTGEPSSSILMKKGGLCRLSVEMLVYTKCATLEWLLAPAHLTKMG